MMTRRHRRAAARSSNKRTRSKLAAGAAIALGAALTPQVAEAATFTVTNTNDAGPGSLRQAVADANATAGVDTVTFAVTGTIVLTSGEIDVTQSVTIDGPGASSLTISGNNTSRIFNIDDANNATFQAVTVRDLTLTAGRAPGGFGSSPANAGGAILNRENLTIDAATLTANSVQGTGGAIHHGGGALNIFNSTLSGNSAGVSGALEVFEATSVTIADTQFLNNAAQADGAARILRVGTVLIEDTTVSGNTSTVGPAGIGLSRASQLVPAIVRRSTFFGNISGAEAGGVAVDRTNLVIENSTISGNVADLGGGLYLYASNVTVRNTTITGNTANTAGGNIFLKESSSLTLQNTIVANGSAPAGPDIHVASGTVTANYSLIETPPATFGGANNITGVDPQLGPLQNNGGATQTHRPAEDSPVIDAGDPACAGCPTTDQRELPRIAGGRVDIGSVELQAGTLSFSSATYAVAENGGVLTITVNRTGGSEGEATVNYATTNGSAAAGADYTARSGTLTFAEGDTSETFNVTILDDTVFEGNETFNVTLSLPSGAILGTATAVVTITENEAAVADLSVTKTIAGAGPYFVGQNVTFNIQVSNAGPGAATNTTITDVLPAGLTFVSATPSAGTCTGTTTVTCSVGTVANGSSATVQLVATIASSGAITNVASAESDLGDPTPSVGSAVVNAASGVAAQVPTLSEWMLMMLASALAAAAALKLRT